MIWLAVSPGLAPSCRLARARGHLAIAPFCLNSLAAPECVPSVGDGPLYVWEGSHGERTTPDPLVRVFWCARTSRDGEGGLPLFTATPVARQQHGLALCRGGERGCSWSSRPHYPGHATWRRRLYSVPLGPLLCCCQARSAWRSTREFRPCRPAARAFGSIARFPSASCCLTRLNPGQPTYRWAWV